MPATCWKSRLVASTQRPPQDSNKALPEAVLEASDTLLEVVKLPSSAHELRFRVHGDVDGVRDIVDNGGSRERERGSARGRGEASSGRVRRDFARARKHTEGIAHTGVLDQRAVSEPPLECVVIDDEGVVALAEVTGCLSLISEPKRVVHRLRREVGRLPCRMRRR